MKNEEIVLTDVLSSDGASIAPQAGGAHLDEPAPAFEGRPLNGRAPIRLADYRGKVIYLDFWASWCKACARSLPWLEMLHREHQAAGFEVISVCVDEAPADARVFLESHPVGFAVVDDSAGDIATLYNVQDLPSSYLIDAKGVLRGAYRGFQSADADRVRTRVASLLRES